jgi:hypothetical protein
MSFALSVLYFVTYYITPATIFGPLADYRIELILAVLVFFVSVPAVAKSLILKTPQSVALIGLTVAVFLSVLIESRWPRGAMQAFLDFIPSIYAYFLVCLHCNSKKKLQIIILMMLFVCLFVIAHGATDLFLGGPGGSRISSESAEDVGSDQWETKHPYLFTMKDKEGTLLYRVRGLGGINDPNDFAQLIVCVIPLMFIFWRSKKTLRNLVFVLLPVGVLLYGIFLTHSRGALLAILAVAVMAGRRRIGTIPSVLLAVGLFAAAMALNFTGGRDISVNAGEDRTQLWSDGLQLLKSHPLFGVGMNNMPEYTDSHQTAHNSVVVCAAELGLFGLAFWSLFLLPTIRDALAAASPAKVSEGEPIEPEETLFPQAAQEVEAIDKAEINRLGSLLVLSLTGFLVAAWFLSRAFVMTFFLMGGMVEVVFEMALERGMIAPRLQMARALRYSGILAVALILMMYVMLRIMNLMH